VAHESAAESLARACEEVPDTALRVSFVRHQLGALPQVDAVDVLALAFRSAELGDHRARQLVAAAAMALAPSTALSLRASLADAAYRRGHRDLARLLTREERDHEPDATRVPDHGTGRPLALGERKSLARRRDRHLLTRVLTDPHPDVIRLLLGNPMIIETDIIRLAARRPAHPEICREIAGSPRWMVRYPVQLTLVKNPGTPRDVALPLVALLRRPDLNEIAGLPDLSHAVQQAATRALSRPLLA